MKPRAVRVSIVFLAAAAVAATMVARVETQQPARGGAAGAAPRPGGAAQRVASVEGITEYRLPNGLRVLLFPDQSKHMVTVNITYLVGSKHEDYGETGMAHLLEHMLFKGSTKHPNIPQELTDHGSWDNGSTWTDRTNYFETVEASEANLGWALDLEADRMVHSFIARKDLDTEFTVVRNEMENGENAPPRVLRQRVYAAAFDWHNYGKDTIGARSDVENVPIDRLQAFYKRYYQPDNAVLMVSGKFDEPKTLALVTELFGPIPKPTRMLPKMYTVEPTQDGERSVTVRRVGDIQLVQVAHHIPAGPHPDVAALDVLATVLGDTPSGRLYKALVETKNAVNAGAFADEMHDAALLVANARVAKDGPLDEARTAMLQVLDDVVRNAPSKDEVDRARTKILKNIDLELAASDEIGLDMSEYVAQGDWRLFFLRRDRIRAVTPADVARVAAAYLKSSNRTVGLFIPTAAPDRAVIPPAPDVAALVKDYRGDEVLAPGEAFTPTPTNIESRTSRMTVAGGVKLALLPRKTRGATVEANLTLHLGNEKDLTSRGLAGAVAAQMLMRGTRRHTREHLQDEFDKLKAQVFVGGGAEAVNASVQTTRANLPAVLRLVAEILREPSFPPAEFEQVRQLALVNLEAQRQQPGPAANLTLNRLLDPYPAGHPRHVLTVDEQIAQYKALTLDDVQKFHADFYGADKAELAVVGDFDDKEVAPLVTEVLSGWKNARPYERIISKVKTGAPAANETLQTPDKANAFFVAALPIDLRQDDPDYPALVLGNYLFGGGFLNSRFPARVRQKEGLSYGAGSFVNADWFDKAGRFNANAIAAPQNIAKVEAAYKEELARVLKDGYTGQEVKAAKAGWLQEREIDRNYLVGQLRQYLFQDRTFTWDADLEEKVAGLTPEQIVAAMRRHIDPAKVSIVKAGDFGGAQK
jgi:zinc protease